MKIIKDLFKHSTKIFNTLKPGDKQQLEEIQRLEEQIKQFQQSDKKEKKEFSISNRLLFKFWFFAMLVVFLGYIAFQSLDILYLILASYIVSIAVEAVIDMFERWKCSR